jgi:uncharacterized protein YdhG (YjbR/CyaY superfamily)
MKKAKDIDSYIASFPKETQKLLEQVRAVIRQAAPEAEEVISYAMPAFKWKKVLVYFAAYKNHIGFYPTSSGIAAFTKDISKYKSSKGAVQFPFDKPLPLQLIKKIVLFRVKEVQAKETAKKLKICPKGHSYYKSSDCPACPICEEARKPQEGFLSILVAPARRALENKGIKTLKQLSKYSEVELLQWHGLGPSTLPKLRLALRAEGLTFKK